MSTGVVFVFIACTWGSTQCILHCVDKSQSDRKLLLLSVPPVGPWQVFTYFWPYTGYREFDTVIN